MTMLYPKTREEWLALRRKFVSSTESSALFGLNKYLTAFELAVAKRDGIELFEQTERSEWGSTLERAIGYMFAEKQNVKARALNAYCDAGDGMGASFDYEIVGSTGDSEIASLYSQHGAGILEIKNVDAWIYKQEWTDEAPAHIELQVQHQLECCQRQWAVLAVLVGGNRLESFIRLRDGEVGQALRSRVRSFWKNLSAGVLPPVTLPQDAAIVAQLYRHAEPGSVMDAQGNETIRDICAQYAIASAEEKAAADRKATCKATLLPLIGTAERVLVEGFTISAGTVGEAQISYTRKAYRNFKVTAKGAKRNAVKTMDSDVAALDKTV